MIYKFLNKYIDLSKIITVSDIIVQNWNPFLLKVIIEFQLFETPSEFIVYLKYDEDYRIINNNDKPIKFGNPAYNNSEYEIKLIDGSWERLNIKDVNNWAIYKKVEVEYNNLIENWRKLV